jgi:hypothetical protein
MHVSDNDNDADGIMKVDRVFALEKILGSSPGVLKNRRKGHLVHVGIPTYVAT